MNKKINLRKLIWVLPLLMIGIFVSCTDEDNFVQQETKIDNNRIQSIVSDNSLSVDIYSALNTVRSEQGIYIFQYKNNKFSIIAFNSVIKEDREPDFTEKDSATFYAWVKKELIGGYTVKVSYDKVTGCYNGWTSRLDNKGEVLDRNNMSQMFYTASLYKHVFNVKTTGRTLILSLDKNTVIAKEKTDITKDDVNPDFWSCDEKIFFEWVNKELKKVNEVVITYDDSTGCFFAWIIKN